MSWESLSNLSTPIFELNPSRRGFLKFTGMGLVVVVGASTLGKGFAAAQEGHGPPPFAKDFNAYIHVKADGRVTCMVGKVELGQGSKTVFAQLVADELDVAYDSVDMLMGDTDLCPFDIGTFASLGMRLYSHFVRGASAEARAVLLQMASEKLQLPVDQLQVEKGVISGGGKKVTYASLVDGKRIERHLEKVPYKKAAALKVARTPVPRRDGMEKVTGRAQYAGDIRVPGMMCARVLRPPAQGAKLKSLDSSALAQVPGAQLVRDGDLIAVLHEKPDMAGKALALLKAEFEVPTEGLDTVSIFEHLTKFTAELKVIKENGNIEDGAKLVNAAYHPARAGVLESTFTTPYGYQAYMETHTALASIENGKVTVWAATQAPFTMKRDLMQALGLPPDKVRVIVSYVGGGFGGKSERTQVGVEAARLAKASGKPVQLVWTRGEDIDNCKLRPAAVMKARSGLDSNGRISLWDYKVFGAGDWGSVTAYDLPHQRVAWVGHWMTGIPSPKDMHPFAVGPWRAPSAPSNVFAVESQIDMMASMAGIDPVEFRLNHLQTNKRMRAVVEAAAKLFGYTPAKGPSGRGIGVACAALYDTYNATAGKGTYVAAIVQLAVNKNTGHVQVKRVAMAVDAGLIINPEGARQQVEGCITMGLGYPLSEELRFKNGAILDRNFDTYQLPQFSWVPKIDITFVEDPDHPPEGLGEPPIIVMGGAIANAVFDAAGVRMMQLPMTPERIRQALAKV